MCTINKLKGYIIEYKKYSQYSIITVSGKGPLKIILKKEKVLNPTSNSVNK